MHPESAQWVYDLADLVVQLMKDCFQTNPLKGTKLKYIAMKLKTYEKPIWMIEPAAIYPPGVKD